ncbi:MAG TPA: hypothetical protein VHM30_15240 [Gemmatimonadaceae bacterium]|nr:hypothetical protein [Gemmatimonadaceae bacterium]
MPVQYQCACGGSYSLRDEFAGRMVECPRCGASGQAPAAGVPFTPESQADPVFDRDLFLLNQKALALNEKYYVADESGQKIAFIERPLNFLRNIAAIAAMFGTLMVLVVASVSISEALPKGAAQLVALLIGLAGAGAGAIFVLARTIPKRHVTFYRDDRKTEKLLMVEQEKAMQWLEATFTVRDAKGKPIGRFTKNYLWDIFRKRWNVTDARGRTVCIAKEDSVILALLRRFMGPMYGLLRTNFVFLRPSDDKVFGEFQRKLTILDRYALDLREDKQRELDRRLALALGVMLDTGERR